MGQPVSLLLVNRSAPPCAIADRLASGTLSDRSLVMALRCDDPRQFQLLARGTPDFIAEIGEIVSWLAAALRSSPDDTINYCTPHIASSGKQSVFYDGAFHDVFDCEIGFEVSADAETDSHVGRCWYGIFRNPVVVGGFPVPRRLRPNTGLEIPLDMAASLIDAKRLHTFAGNLFLKGFSAMLTPVEVIGNVVLWHLYFNAAGGRISYLDIGPRASSDRLGANILQSSRHVIGWCSEALYLAGKFRTLKWRSTAGMFWAGY